MVIDNLPIENTGQFHMLSTGRNPVKMLVHLPLINVCRYHLVVKGNQIMKIRGKNPRELGGNITAVVFSYIFLFYYEIYRIFSSKHQNSIFL